MPKQIGWSNESNLLYTISSQISRLAGVIAASGGGGGGGTITGGGASGQVTFWNGATSITGSNNLFWDSTISCLGIGVSSLTSNIRRLVIGGLSNSFIQTRGSKNFTFGTEGNNFIFYDDSVGAYRLTISNAGNLIVGGSTTDDGVNRLQVSGSARVSGDLTVVSASANAAITVSSTSSSTVFSGNAANSSTAALELQNLGVRRLRILSTATATTFESSNQTGAFIFNKDVTVSGNLNVTGESVMLGSGTSTVSFISGYNNSFIGNRLILYSTATNLRGIYAGGQGWILSKSSGLADLYPTAIFAIDSTNQGFLPPRMTEAQRNAIASPAAGLTIYNTTVNDLEVYNGSTWVNDGATVITNRQTASYTLALTDRGKLVETNVGAANTITVPPNSSITFPIGTKIDIAQYGAGQTTIVPGIGVTVRSAGGALKLSAQYSGATIVKIGTDEWYLFGDITV